MMLIIIIIIIIIISLVRWIRFEENVEEGGERWSKPHVATLSLHALFELRRGLSAGTVMLDVEAANIAQVAGAMNQLSYYSVAHKKLNIHKTLRDYSLGRGFICEDHLGLL